MGLTPQILGSRWTGRGGRITLRIAHGDRLLTVPVWDLFSGQDKSPEPLVSAPLQRIMSHRAHRRTRLDPRDLCLVTLSQGFTITRELQPNGLHPKPNGDPTHDDIQPRLARSGLGGRPGGAPGAIRFPGWNYCSELESVEPMFLTRFDYTYNLLYKLYINTYNVKSGVGRPTAHDLHLP